VTYAERVAEELRPFEVTVRVGERLGAAVRSGDEEATFGARFLDPVAERFFLESGLRLGRGFYLEEAPGAMGPWEYEIVINDLPRSCGTAPESTGAAALSEDLLGCLGEAAHELIGVGWTERYLEHLAVLSPPLVAAVRRRYTVEVVCWLISRLVADRFSLRDDRILDCLLEFEPPVDDLAALWRHTRSRLRDSLAFRLSGDGRTVSAIELDPESESKLRAGISTEGSVFAGYSARDALPLLRQMRILVERSPDTRPVLVTAPDLRAHVERIVTAQFPTVPVVAHDELSPEIQTELVGRIAIAG
jgi:type III secretory pathway component EscV